MKKRIALLLGMVMVVSSLAVGCGEEKAPEQDATTNDQVEASTEEQTAGDETVVTEGGLKTGYAIITEASAGHSKDATADEEGTIEVNANMAAVVVDENGVIVNCVIDVAQTPINFNAEGVITTDLATEFKTKNELGPDYGMVAYGGAVAEWNEQAAAFAQYCVGKTVDEVMGMEVTEEGTAADADLAATCTVHVGGFQAVVAKAVENATVSGAQAGDKLGLGAVTNIAKSTDATADEAGVAQAYTTMTVVTVNADGVITSAIIDAVQANVNFDATGKITTDLTAEIPSKNELGPDYGMVAYGGAIAEWNEQAAAYAAYATGKTVDEVNATAVTEGVPADADLAASVTIHIGDFNTVIEKAVNTAK